MKIMKIITSILIAGIIIFCAIGIYKVRFQKITLELADHADIHGNFVIIVFGCGLIYFLLRDILKKK